MYKNNAIFGAPRSGTSWLGQLFNASPNCIYRYQPLFSYEFKHYLSTESTESDIRQFHSDLITAKSKFVLTDHTFYKKEITHLAWKEVRYHHITQNLLKNSDIKIVYIQRDALSTINSWYNAPKEFDKDKWDIFNEWKYAPSKNRDLPEEFNGYKKWQEVRSIHTANKSRYPDRVYMVDYNDLKTDTISTLKEIYNFCGLKWDIQVSNFIKETITTHDSDAYSVYKNKSIDINLPDTIIKQLDE